MDYGSNSNKDKEKLAIAVPAKDVKPVVKGEVVIKKKSLGRKVRDMFIEADLRSVLRYIGTDVLLPAARNMIVDASSKGVERMMYGESATRRRGYSGGPRTTYNSPVSRSYSSYNTPPGRSAPPVDRSPRGSRAAGTDYILASREDAELVLERMNDIIDNYEVVTVADLNELVEFPSSHVDNKWGWIYLADVHIRQTREGYLIDLPPAEPVTPQ